jgi:putative phosphotransacetylase
MQDEKMIREIVKNVVDTLEKNGYLSGSSKNAIPIGVSNRHLHLSRADVDSLFGKGFTLTKMKDLSQPGQFACNEVVEVWVGDRVIKNVRILGPERTETQVEVSASDARSLRVFDAQVRASGDLRGTNAFRLVGPKGSVTHSEGLIIANRHIHLHTSDAKRMGVRDKDVVSVFVPGEKGGVMHHVTCRVKDSYALDMHIDTDDAAAFRLDTGDFVELIK